MFRQATFLALVASAAASSGTVRGTNRELSECASLPTDKYCKIIDKGNHQALNIADAAMWPGASAVQWEELADTHDNWRFESAGDGYYVVFVEHSGLSLVAQGSFDGANVVQGGERDEWCFVDQGNGFYKINNRKNEGFVLDTVDMTHGASVVVKSDGNSENNQWRVECFKDIRQPDDKCVSMDTSKYCHIIAKHSQMAVAVDNASTNTGAKVIQSYESDSSSDNWILQPGGGGYKIVNENSKLSLASTGFTKGSKVVQNHGGDDWCFVDRGSGYYEIKNSNTNMALDVHKISHKAGADIITWVWGDGQANRLWRLNCGVSAASEAKPVETPKPPSSGCGKLTTCHLIDLNSKSETLLQPDTKFKYSLATTDRYTVRCDTDGNMDQVDFFYGTKRHSEWDAPWFMEYAGDNWIEPVPALKTCGATDFRVAGKTWKHGKCFEAFFSLEGVDC